VGSKSTPKSNSAPRFCFDTKQTGFGEPESEILFQGEAPRGNLVEDASEIPPRLSHFALSKQHIVANSCLELKMRATPIAVIACLFLTGCLTDDTDAVRRPESVDCVSTGIPARLLAVASHDEMVERYGKPTNENRREDGSVQSSYAKVDVSNVYGCAAPSRGGTVQYQSVQFEFDSRGKFQTASSSTANPEPSPQPARKPKRQ
jgi:hypothetical protein